MLVCMIRTRNAQQLAELAALALLQDQWMPQKLVDGILIEGNPLPLTQEHLSLTPSFVGQALA